MALFGRESEVKRIVDDCVSERLVVVSSPPGRGMSELLSEGVAPALKAKGFIPVVLRDWQGRGFVTDLKEAIADAVRTHAWEGFYADVEPLDEMLQRIRTTTGHQAVLILDQFEDYLRCHTGTDVSDAFDADLSNAVAGRAGRFVIGLHDYGLKAFDRFSQYVPHLLGYHFVLQPLSAEAGRQLVRTECARRNFQIEPAAEEALISGSVAIHEAGVHPFLLMMGLDRLLEYEGRLKSNVARMSTVEGNGGGERLILESLDQKIGDLRTTHLELFFRWCNILISPEKHRVSVTEKALTQYAGKLNRFVPTLLPILEENGLLRSVTTHDVVRYEIARDSLTPIIADWRFRRETDILARRRARFRVRSISVAAACMLAVYIVYLILTWKS